MKKGILIVGGLLALLVVLKSKAAQAAPGVPEIDSGPILGEQPPSERGLGYTPPGLQTQTVQLVRGYNTVTLTVLPFDNNLLAVFPHAMRAEWWNAAATSPHYEIVSILNAGEEYKIYNSVDETITIVGGPSRILAPVEEPGGWPIVQNTPPSIVETVPPIVIR